MKLLGKYCYGANLKESVFNGIKIKKLAEWMFPNIVVINDAHFYHFYEILDNQTMKGQSDLQQ